MIHLITHHRIQIIQMRVLHACYLANSYTHTHTHTQNTHTRSFSVKVALFLVLIFDGLGLVKENLSRNWSRFYFYVLGGLYVIQLSVKVLKKLKGQTRWSHSLLTHQLIPGGRDMELSTIWHQYICNTYKIGYLLHKNKSSYYQVLHNCPHHRLGSENNRAGFHLLMPKHQCNSTEGEHSQ